MTDKDILGTNENINALCDWIEECRGMLHLFPGYINDAIDTDKEGCFV